LKLALLMGSCPSGECGVGDYTRRLATALETIGVATELLAEGRWGLLDVGTTIKRLKKLRPDITHIQYPTAGFGYGLTPQLLAINKKSVVTLHEASQAHFLRKVALYPFTLRPQHVIFTSEYERRFALSWAPWITRHSSVIPIGSNIDGLPEGSKRRVREIAHFGLIMPGKGLEEVLQLAKLLRSSELKIRIIGKTHEKHQQYFAWLRMQSKELPIIWDTELVDHEVAKRLGECAVAYLPFPDGASERRATLKAMLVNGVAVVTKRGAHTPASLEKVVNFADNIKDAYGALCLLLSDCTERERLSRSGIEYMRQFTWEHIADLHSQVYKDVVRSQISGRTTNRESGVLPC
jgi:glycosyltransferase involved in cell wall biosynthesis